MATKYRAAPRIRARQITAADLLLRIKREILAEPARADMATWITAFQGQDGHRPLIEAQFCHRRRPACGTVACIAGWGAVLLRPKGSVPRIATASRTMDDLIGGAQGLFSAFGDDIEQHPTGTKKYARAVADRIDRFIEDRPYLKTRVIDVQRRRVVVEL